GTDLGPRVLDDAEARGEREPAEDGRPSRVGPPERTPGEVELAILARQDQGEIVAHDAAARVARGERGLARARRSVEEVAPSLPDGARRVHKSSSAARRLPGYGGADVVLDGADIGLVDTPREKDLPAAPLRVEPARQPISEVPDAAPVAGHEDRVRL